jgi:hypothetical protein
MVGVQNNMFYFANLALATLDPVQAANAAAFTLQNANWISTTGMNYSSIGGIQENGLYYGRVFKSCEPPGPTSSNQLWCDSGVSGGVSVARDLNGEGMNVASMAGYFYPTNESVLRLGDLMMNAMYACPGDPRSDGTCIVFSDLGNYMYSGASVAKWFGYYYGIGANWAWPSVRLGGLMPPAPRVVQVTLDFQAATKALLTVVRPDGTSTTVTCTTSPCPVTIDARQGDHLLSIRYLDPSSRQVASAPATVLRAR